jgi:hypothetical protein
MAGRKYPGVHARQVLGERILQPAAGASANLSCVGLPSTVLMYSICMGAQWPALLLQNWDREAAEDQPIVVNPLRHSIPPQFRNGEKLVCMRPAAASAA